MSKILEFKSKDKKTGKEKVVGKIEIKNQTKDDAELYFYGDIVSTTWGCWEEEDKCPQDIANFLNEIEGNKNLTIYVNSGGGSVFAGIAIYNQLKRHQGYKIVHVDGLAASITSVIALVGDKVIIHSGAQFMIHKPWTLGYGNANDFRDLANRLDTAEESIMNIYAENLKEGVDIQIIREMVDKETWLTGEQAAQYFNVEVSEGNDIAACASDYFKDYRNVPENIKNMIQDNNNPKIENKPVMDEATKIMLSRIENKLK